MPKLVQLKDKDGNIYPITILETITNSDGTAIKYADGTMMCYGHKSSSLYTPSDMWSWCDRTGSLTVDFPVAFKEKPTVTLNSLTFTIISCNFKNIDADRFTFYGFQPKNCGTTSLAISYIAIGKWK